MHSRKRKNFLATLLLAVLFWGVWGWLVYFKAPTENFLLLAFYVSLFLAVFFTSALIFANSRRGLLLASLIILSLLFRYYQIGNLLNIILLASIFVIFEIYLAK